MSSTLALTPLTESTRTREEISTRKQPSIISASDPTQLKISPVFEQVIQAISALVESHDPYTAVHHRRVSLLCAEIGRSLNLPPSQVEGITLAALIHDVGKLNIPSEILSKPGKLTDVERSIIQAHATTGFEILKGIDFPWPIARTILQHHERLNGSGYPAGLGRQDILLEAKILAVADVIEAMASYRPFRPALGVNIALEEISQNKSVLYDEGVVEACLNILNPNKSGQPAICFVA